MSGEGITGSGDNEEVDRLKVRKKWAENSSWGRRNQGDKLATGRGGGEIKGVAGHQGTETKNTGISEHIGKNTIKIINEIQFFTYHINNNKKTTTLKMERLEKNEYS